MQSEAFWEGVIIGGISSDEEARKIVEEHNRNAAQRRKMPKGGVMNQEDQKRLLRESGVEIAPEEIRDVTEVGVDLGLLKLIPVGREMMEIFDEADKAQERRMGRVIQTIGFGVEIFEVVDARDTDDEAVQAE